MRVHRIGMLILTALIALVLASPELRAAPPAPPPLPAEVAEAFRSLKAATGDARAQAYHKLATLGDGRLVPGLQAYQAGLLEDQAGRLVIYQSRVNLPGKDAKAYPVVDAFTLEALPGADGRPLLVEDVGSDTFANRDMWKAPRADRKQISELVTLLSLADPDPSKRRQAILDAGERSDLAALPGLKAQLDREPKGKWAPLLLEAKARIEVVHGDKPAKLAAAAHLGALGASRAAPSLSKALEAATAAQDPELQAACQAAIARIESYQSIVRWVQHTFSGLSLASILILMALGLSIIFGVMGVINMAHGEFMMIGAFTALVVSEFFKDHLPGAFDWYPLAAFPAAFVVAGTVGFFCEMLIIRRLYGRPLETMLATWGVSLALIQAARWKFGDTSSLTPPSWLVGGWEVATDLVLPLNRLFILAFTAACVAGTYLLIERTRLGLLLRATTQNRQMADCLGVRTRRIDGLTFAFGAGLAGLAGVVVPLFDKINPQMGQGYIVDSFMVVVVGGVGKLAGTVIAGTGLGFLGKYIEPLIGGTGSVIYSKIIILALIIAFLQRKPSGLFAPKGRLAEA